MCIADLTLNHGVAATKGHLESNGGLRGHSVGHSFPYVVIAKGNPNTDLKWFVQTPQGVVLDTPYNTAQEAEEAAIYCKLTHR